MDQGTLLSQMIHRTVSAISFGGQRGVWYQGRSYPSIVYKEGVCHGGGLGCCDRLT